MYLFPLMGLKTLGRISSILFKGDNFYDSLSVFLRLKSLLKRIYFKRNKFSRVEQILFFREISFQKEVNLFLIELPSLKMNSFSLRRLDTPDRFPSALTIRVNFCNFPCFPEILSTLPEVVCFKKKTNAHKKSNVFPCRVGPEVIKLFSISTQLSMKFYLLINMKMPTIVGIFIFISREISRSAI